MYEIRLFFQLLNLPDPFGDCVVNAAPISDCQLECEAEHVNKICQCTQPYMRTAGNYTECDMEQTFNCVQEALGNIHKQ